MKLDFKYQIDNLIIAKQRRKTLSRRRNAMFAFGANGSTESSIIKTVFKSERKQIICHCGTLLDVPLDPAPFNCTSDYCSGRYIHDKDRRIFKIQDKKLFSIITA